MATVGVISQKINALTVAADQATTRRGSCHKVEKMSAIHGGEIVELSHQLPMLDEDGNGASGGPDWTLHPIFNDDDNCCYTEKYK
ncbi:hypothetical protein ACUV84_039198 [Puccinellia chinampoensis]